jgi:hypothetical protein
MDFIWDLHQDGRIQDAQQEARVAGSKADAVVSEFARMQRRLDRLSLGCQAMWELLRERAGITARHSPRMSVTGIRGNCCGSGQGSRRRN